MGWSFIFNTSTQTQTNLFKVEQIVTLQIILVDCSCLYFLTV